MAQNVTAMLQQSGFTAKPSLSLSFIAEPFVGFDTAGSAAQLGALHGFLFAREIVVDVGCRK